MDISKHEFTFYMFLSYGKSIPLSIYRVKLDTSLPLYACNAFKYNSFASFEIRQVGFQQQGIGSRHGQHRYFRTTCEDEARTNLSREERTFSLLLPVHVYHIVYENRLSAIPASSGKSLAAKQNRIFLLSTLITTSPSSVVVSKIMNPNRIANPETEQKVKTPQLGEYKIYQANTYKKDKHELIRKDKYI
ncbi:recombination factor protein RarA [Striga asiatica]|uniref:Recombination factor protein RarA n=1 Tax=Striga asiatica TaxID=4170 RepID=A0A5A7P525_STRAF|nr:recombination factor protein RarA [Striga asiatica]